MDRTLMSEKIHNSDVLAQLNLNGDHRYEFELLAGKITRFVGVTKDEMCEYFLKQYKRRNKMMPAETTLARVATILVNTKSWEEFKERVKKAGLKGTPYKLLTRTFPWLICPDFDVPDLSRKRRMNLPANPAYLTTAHQAKKAGAQVIPFKPMAAAQSLVTAGKINLFEDAKDVITVVLSSMIYEPGDEAGLRKEIMRSIRSSRNRASGPIPPPPQKSAIAVYAGLVSQCETESEFLAKLKTALWKSSRINDKMKARFNWRFKFSPSGT